MGNALPLLFKLAPFPPFPKGWTPQQFANALIARLSAESNIPFCLFVTGSTAPTSDVGPWLNTGADPGWYVWDTGTGAYVPCPVPQSSLKWIISITAPDPAVYSFWITIDGSGKAQDIQTFSNGAWHSVYEDATAAIAASIAAVAANLAATNVEVSDAEADIVSLKSPVNYPFRARPANSQSVTAGAGETQMTLGTKDYDPNNVFNASVFTAPVDGYYHFELSVGLSLNSGSPTGIDFNIYIRRGGSSVAAVDEYTSDDTSGHTYKIAVDLFLTAGDQVDAAVDITTTGASVWDISFDNRRSFLSGFLIQKT